MSEVSIPSDEVREKYELLDARAPELFDRIHRFLEQFPDYKEPADVHETEHNAQSRVATHYVTFGGDEISAIVKFQHRQGFSVVEGVAATARTSAL